MSLESWRSLHPRLGFWLLLALSLLLFALELAGADRNTEAISGLFWLPLLLVPSLGRSGDLLSLGLVDLGLMLWLVIASSDAAVEHLLHHMPLRAVVFLLILWLNQLRSRDSDSRRWLEAIELGSPMGLALVELPGARLLQVNPAMAELLAAAPEALIGRSWCDFGRPLNPGEQAQRQQLLTCTLRHRWAKVAVQEIRGLDASRRLLVVQAVDCQDNVDAEHALAAQAEELRRQLAVSLEACSVSHEIRQPLSLLQLQCRRLQHRLESGAVAETDLVDDLAVLAGTADQINTTISSMLSLLRSGSSQQQQMDLAAVVRASIQNLSPQCKAAGVTVTIEGLDEPVLLLGSQVQLRIACGNLLTNSLEALASQPSGSRRILVRLQRQGWAALELLVADSGPGLQGRTLRALALASNKTDGMGLGLFTSAMIAEHHRGSLLAGASAELGGAELRLSLPCLPLADSARLSQASSHSDAARPPAPVPRR